MTFLCSGIAAAVADGDANHSHSLEEEEVESSSLVRPNGYLRGKRRGLREALDSLGKKLDSRNSSLHLWSTTRSFLFVCSVEDRPLFVQFCANDPDTLLEAARRVEPYCDYVDINLGCPQRIAKRGNYGAFLMDNLSVVRALMLEEAGCALLAVHGRTRDEKDGKKFRANWPFIKAVRDSVRIPVLANGNIRHMDDIQNCLEETGADGVLSAETLLENPALFAGYLTTEWASGSNGTMEDGQLDQAELLVEYLKFCERYPVPWRIIRSHVHKMLGEWFRIHPDFWHCCSAHVFWHLATATTISISSPGENKRAALEIIIGFNPPLAPPLNPHVPPLPPPPECPPPPPPPKPLHHPSPPPKRLHHPSSPPKRPPSPILPIPFETSELRRIEKVIQRFRRTIIHDPNGITKTWTGKDQLCKNSSAYKGFICYTTRKDHRRAVGGIDFNGQDLGNSTNPLSLQNYVEEFKDLVVIHVNSNYFTGTIPPGISVSNLPTLFELDVSNNKLSGPFPNPVLAATNLTYLDLRFNFFHSQLPSQVFTLDLDALFLNNNGFSGPLPDNLGSTPVFFLTLANNYFTGPIPRSIGDASKYLLEVLFLNNSLSGCLPWEIGSSRNATVFDASKNQITGPIPHSFGCLKKLQILNLSTNKMYGTIPESLCALGDLEELSLGSNYFTQVGEQCRKLIARKILDVKNNCILGLPNQRTPQECSDFFSKHMQRCSDEKTMLSHLPPGFSY
nr:tRNA-dihydrouridine(16/17) synthase [NAD(P)(+)]-like [Ipomoea batatas]